MNPRLPKGRGAVSNAAGRYESLSREPVAEEGWGDAETPAAWRTRLTEDQARSLITRNRSPDLPFAQSINPYRGCEHGCIYCFARPTHAYLGLSPGLDFETRLFVKSRAAELLRGALAAPGYRCQVLALGTNTDPYQPVERRRGLTRQLLEVLAAARHPVAITTKSALVERDLDLLAPMAARGLAKVSLSVTTLDRTLAARLEPRANAPHRRLQTIRRLAAAGVPVNVSVAPIIPVLTDPELENIVAAAADAGASTASYLLLRLPGEVAGLFQEWLQQHYPHRAAHVMSIVRQCRGGRDNDPRFGWRLRGSGEFARLLAQRFELAVRRHRLEQTWRELDTTQFRPPPGWTDQLSLF